MIDEKSQWLIDWCDRMVAKYGQPLDDMDWCRKLAYYMGEQGNDSPSIEAIEQAKVW